MAIPNSEPTQKKKKKRTRTFNRQNLRLISQQRLRRNQRKFRNLHGGRRA